MTESIIRIENLSKRYLIGHQRDRQQLTHDNGLRHALDRAVRPSTWVRALRGRTAPLEEFWALRGINLDVNHGEVVGIIGRNGAGKSTLLKILSRITEPTKGRIRLRGRVASLLEVATGFHPELTGRENVFLNGAILGMTRAEIKSRFDEIVAFAEIEKFLDTPVKRYSSGMYVRLAFAVAAHLEPDILIVDEVLAVGDSEFQKKCLNKMDEAGQTGRTVLFVSHNMQAVTRLSTRCVLLEHGTVRLDGPSARVASAYLTSGMGTTAIREWPDLSIAPGNDVARLCAVRVRSKEGDYIDTLDIRRPVGIELEYEVLNENYVFHPHFGVYNEDGQLLFMAQDVDLTWRRRRRPRGRYISTAWIPGNLLPEGALSVGVVLMTLNPETVHVDVDDAVLFRVVDNLSAADTARGDYPRPIPGLVRPMLEWTTSHIPSHRTVPAMTP